MYFNLTSPIDFVSILAFYMHKKTKVNANTFIASDTKGIQTRIECMCVCCEMQKLCTHHNINTQELLCLKIAFHWLKQMGYISMDCTHIITSPLLFFFFLKKYLV